MINEKLIFEVAERYGIKVTKKKPGEGGFLFNGNNLETLYVENLITSIFTNQNTFFDFYQDNIFEVNEFFSCAA